MSDMNKDSGKQDNRNNYTDSRNEAVKNKVKEEQRERELDEKKNKEEKTNKETLEKIKNNGKKEQTESNSNPNSSYTYSSTPHKARQIYKVPSNNELNIAKNQRNQQAATSYGQNITDKQREYDEMMRKKTSNSSITSINSGGVKRYSQNDLVKSILNAQNNTNNARKANITPSNSSNLNTGIKLNYGEAKANKLLERKNKGIDKIVKFKQNPNGKLVIPEIYKTKGLKRDAYERFQQRKITNVKMIISNAVLNSSDDAAKGLRSVTIAMGMVKVIPMVSAKKAYERQYRNYLMKRNDSTFIHKRNAYLKQLSQFKKGQIDKIDSKLKPTKLDKAIMRGDFRTIRKLETQRINRILVKNGFSNPIRSPYDLVRVCDRNLKKYKNNESLSPEVLQAFKDGKELGKIQRIRSGIGRTLTNQLRQTANSYIRRTEGLEGLYTVSDITKKTTRLVTSQIRNIQMAHRVIRDIIRKNEVAVMKKFLEKYNNASHHTKHQQRKMQMYQKKQVKTQIKENKIEAVANKKKQKANKKNNRKDLRKKKRRDRRLLRKSKFMNSKLGKFFTKIKGSKLGRVIGKVGRKISFAKRLVTDTTGLVKDAISKIISFIADKIFSIKKMLMMVGGVLLTIYMVVLIVLLIVQLIIMFFDFSLASNKTIMTDYLQKLYIDDLSYISYKYEGSGYTITFDDVRDEAVYQQESEKSGNNTTEENQDESQTDDQDDDTVWFQSTNGAEICSMAYVNFDMDLESYKKEDIKEYVKGLYYGSHEIVGTDNGTSGTITLRTYYFNSLFTRGHGSGVEWQKPKGDGSQENALHSKENVQSGISGGLASTSVNASTIYNTLKNQCGYTSIAACGLLGSVYGETGGYDFNPNTVGCNHAYGAYQFDPNGDLPNFSRWCRQNNRKINDLAAQTEYVQEVLPERFRAFTGGNSVYDYSCGYTTDVTRYHVWTKTAYTYDDFRNWGVQSNMAEELIADFYKHGDSKMEGGGNAVKEYMNSLTDEEKAVAYAALLFTRVYERPSTKDWITQRVKMAVTYYRMVSGTQSVIGYAQGYYQEFYNGSGWCGISTLAGMFASVGIMNGDHLIDPCDLRQMQGSGIGNDLTFWVNNLLAPSGAIDCSNGDPGGPGIKYIIKWDNAAGSGSMTREELYSHLEQGHLVMIQTACNSNDTTESFKCYDAYWCNHWAFAYGVDTDGKILLMDPAGSDASIEAPQGSCTQHGYMSGVNKKINDPVYLRTLGYMPSHGSNVSGNRTLIIWRD